MDPNIPKIGLVKIKTVLNVIEMSPSKWWAGVAAGIFPQPKRMGASTFWDASDIRLFIQDPSRTNWPVYQTQVTDEKINSVSINSDV